MLRVTEVAVCDTVEEKKVLLRVETDRVLAFIVGAMICPFSTVTSTSTVVQCFVVSMVRYLANTTA